MTTTPQQALQALIQGNIRFQNNQMKDRNLLDQVRETSAGQSPFAVVLSCIDSRTSSELIFDQGIGDIFSIRIAGNFINDDILGSMEFACHIAGAKLIVVLGHTNCGAITAACRGGGGEGNLGQLLAKICPTVELTALRSTHSHDSSAFIEQVACTNVHLALEQVRDQSAVLAQMEREGTIGIVGGIYDVKTGATSFFQDAKKRWDGVVSSPPLTTISSS